MVRSVVVLTMVGMLSASVAEAQTTAFTGFVTGQIGSAHGGDIRDGGLTLAGSMAVIEERGMGAELDLGHTRRFDSGFAESGITTMMLNVLYLRPHEKVRPFAGAGVGLLRVRAAIFDGQTPASRTDLGFNAGGGLLYLFNDALGVRGDMRYTRYFQRHSDLPLTDNGFFDFWRTSVGATFSWPIR